MNQDRIRTIAIWLAALVASVAVIAISWSFRPNSDEAAPPTSTNIPREEPVVRSPTEETASDDVEPVVLDTIGIDVDRAVAELEERVPAFEAGYRTLLKNDTAQTRRDRVTHLVSPDTIDYLNFDEGVALGAAERDYDIEVRVDDPLGYIDGLTRQIATGNVELVVDVTYARVETDGTRTDMGTLSKRSRWSYIDGEWLLTGADT